MRFLKKKGTIYDLILIDQYVDRSLLNYLSERNNEVSNRTNFICLDNNFGTLYQDDLKIYKLHFNGQIESINIDDYYIQSNELIHSDFSEISLNNTPKIVNKIITKERVYVTKNNTIIDVLFIYNIACSQIIKVLE
ncbi:hypothetical protein FIA58_020730 [Flavobacterium jejuense]|uniref:Uncharacterized protein n=1 Tax=Flavobacterium jejuense TaxID=1544455 RepID=A0ABX0IY90_9FLAO|nr:hypothetical protein [Flavobacterium jejuense]NHN28111.1 hypothetical protein [Flavobacterium jejuense]